jgi:fructoselysine 6-kinase
MSLVAIGDNVIDCYVDLGLMFPGGNSVNVAVHASRAGTPTAYVGVVGDDERGAVMTDALWAEGVDRTRLRTRRGTTASAVVRHVWGERIFGANDKGVSLFRPTAADLAFVAGFDLAHTSYCSGLESALPALASRVKVSYDFNDRTHDGYAGDLLPHVWVATFSASHLSRPDCEDLLRWAHSRGPAYVFATRGAEGALGYDGTEVCSAAARPVDVTDSLGAGDAFTGRALHGILRAEPTAALLSAAVRAGSSACTTLGGFGHGRSLPDRGGGTLSRPSAGVRDASPAAWPAR